MGILTKEIEIKPNSKSIQYYKDLGYDAKWRTPLIVKIEDLQKNSHVDVEVLCDICKRNTMIIAYDVYNRVVKNTGNYVCKECSQKKRSETSQKKYGVTNPLKSKVVQEKTKKTNLKRYGVENYGQTKECHEKIKQTCLKKYGVEHFAKSKEIKDKRIKTNLERYGVENAACTSQAIKNMQITNLQKYGVLYGLQLPEIRAKRMRTLYQNGTQKTSRQQLYLHSLYGGELNYPIKHYDVDICFPKDKLYVEYDGGGHDLRVTLGKLTQEEFNQKEIIRNNIIKREGYKQMRIISTKDLLPSDSILLQMLEMTREYFSNYPNHSWIEFNIDTSTVQNAEHKNSIYYDFGVLRTIKSDLNTTKSFNNK